MTIKLVVLDIDGTIAGEDNQISPAVLATIQKVQERGIGVALATGRMHASALRFHRQIQSSLPLISYNGALTKHPETGATLREWALPKAIALEILDYFEFLFGPELLEVHCYHQDQLYVRTITPETQRYMARAGVMAQTTTDLRNIIQKTTTKLLAISPEPQLIEQLGLDLKQRYSSQQVYFTQSTETYFEVTHPQATKGLAIQHLAEEILGLSAENVLAIGDNFNDLDMLAYAGIGVAMGNAPGAVKAQADLVTTSVADDGVSRTLHRLCL